MAENTSSSESSLPEDAKAKLVAALGGTTSQSAKDADSHSATSKGQDVGSIVARIIEDATGLPLDEITSQSRFDDDLGIDSLSKIDIAVQTEDRFGIRVEEDDLSGQRTVKDLVEYIETHQKDS